ncbi:MAG TPA: Flp family type IVb pilin [Sphingomonas sp.]|jgi:pilus assembly protein Flp/PilA|uniref:Flp family type IVb pilin n=1 Tax=Sphingomonas sp. TaxID=28214 RepID=UPI002EDACFCD
MRSLDAPVRLLAAVLRSRRGATAVEYGMIAALVVVAMFVGLSGLADTINALWNHVAREVLAKA